MTLETPKAAADLPEAFGRDVLDLLRTAAMELIAEGGLKALTFAAVGARAGVSRGLSGYHFGSKAGLLRSLLDNLVAKRLEDYGRQEGQIGLDGILANLDRVVDGYRSRPLQQQGFVILTTEGLVNGDPVIRERIFEYNAAVHKIIAARFEEELQLRPGRAFNADGMAAVYIATMKGIALKWMADRDFDEVRLAVTTFKTMLINSIRGETAEGQGAQVRSGSMKKNGGKA